MRATFPFSALRPAFLRQFGIVLMLLLMLDCCVLADVFVSPSGSDANPGTAAAPVLTPARAQALARKEGAAGNHIRLRGGLYLLKAPLALTSVDSGETWEAEGSGTPVLSGGRIVAGWTLHDADKDIWQARVGSDADFRELWVNGVRYVRAYSTDVSNLLPGATFTGAGFACAGSPLTGFRHPEAIELVWRLAWEDRRCPLAIVNSSGVTCAPGPFTVLQNSDALHVSSPPYSIENAYELLSSSTPGQFYLDKPAHILYLVPRPEDDLRTAQVIIPALTTPVTATGADKVTFSGLAFSHSAWTYPNAHGFPEIQTDTYAVLDKWPVVKGDVPRLPGCVAVSGGDGMAFRRCAFTHIAADGLSLDDGIRRPLVIGCSFSDIGGTGLAISRPSDYHTSLLPSYVMVRDNTFTTCGAQYKGCTALSAPYSDHLTVRNNDLRDLPYTAIHIGWGWGDPTVAGNGNRATLIAYNRIDRPMLVMHDGGGIYLNGATASALVVGNVVTGLASDFAYYLDDGSIHKVVRNNIAFDDRDHAYHCNNNVGSNTVDYNFFDQTGAYLDQPQGLRGTPYNSYGPNQSGLTPTTLPVGILGYAGLEPGYGGKSPVNSHSPGAPTAVAVQVSGASVTVTFTPPQHTGLGGVTAYEVSDGNLLVYVATDRSATFPVPPGVTHQITVRARDAQGDLSLPSQPITIRTEAHAF